MTDAPVQMAALFTVTLGRGFTVIVPVAMLMQVFGSVPATVYTVVVLGDAVSEAPVAMVFQV